MIPRFQGFLFIGILQLSVTAAAEPPQDPHFTIGKATMTTHATGSFEVKLIPQQDADGDPSIGRMTIDKQFAGDLQATSKGQMLSAMGEVKGSAGYVAMERVVGSLHGRKGSFVLQHSGTMNRGEPLLVLSVVPDSGTDELRGLRGAMKIIVAAGQHSYEFDYTLEPTA